MRSIMSTLLWAISLLLSAPACAQAQRGVYAFTDVAVDPTQWTRPAR